MRKRVHISLGDSNLSDGGSGLRVMQNGGKLVSGLGQLKRMSATVKFGRNHSGRRTSGSRKNPRCQRCTLKGRVLDVVRPIRRNGLRVRHRNVVNDKRCVNARNVALDDIGSRQNARLGIFELTQRVVVRAIRCDRVEVAIGCPAERSTGQVDVCDSRSRVRPVLPLHLTQPVGTADDGVIRIVDCCRNGAARTESGLGEQCVRQSCHFARRPDINT